MQQKAPPYGGVFLFEGGLNYYYYAFVVSLTCTPCSLRSNVQHAYFFCSLVRGERSKR